MAQLAHHQKGFLLITVVVILSVLAAMALLLTHSASMDNTVSAKNAESATLDYLLESGLSHNLYQLSQNTSCNNYTELPSTQFGGSDGRYNSYSTSISPKSGSPISISVEGALASGTTRTRVYDEIEVYGEEARHQNLYPGAEGKDTQVSFSSKSKNYGATAELTINGGSSPDHILLEFDLSNIPAGSKITKAELELQLKDMSSADTTAAFTVHPMITAWSEGTGDGSSTGDGATWNTSDGSTSWSWPSNHSDAYPVATTVVDGTFKGEHKWDVRPLVQQWADGVLANNGMLIVGNDQVGDAVFYSSDHSNKHPKLHIHYSCECGVDCATPVTFSCDADFIPNNEVSTMAPSTFGLNDFSGISHLPEAAEFNGYSPASGGASLMVGTNSQLYVVAGDGTVGATCSLPDPALGVAYIESGKYEEKVAVAFSDRIQYFEGSCVASEQFSTSNIDNATPSGIVHMAVTATGTYDDYLAITDSGSKKVYLVKQDGTDAESLDLSGLVSSVNGVTHIPGTDKLLLADSTEGKVHVIDMVNFSTLATLAQYNLSAYGVAQPQGITINGSSCDHIVGSAISDAVVSLNKVHGIVAHWKMDETGGLVATDSEGGHHGDLKNSPVWAPSVGVEGALQFDASNDYVEVPHDSTLSLGSAVTFSAWLYNDSANFSTEQSRVISKNQSSVTNYGIGFNAGRLYVLLGNGGYLFSSGLFVPNSWFHITVSIDSVAGDIIAYVNGAEIGRYSGSSFSVTSNTAPLMIGYNFQGRGWSGYIDDVRMYNKILSDTEINDIYSAASPVPPPSVASCNGTYRDEFNSIFYSGNDGTLSWGGDWQEINENDGPWKGDESVLNSEKYARENVYSFQLNVGDSDWGGEGVMRALNLEGAARATLSFAYSPRKLYNAFEYISVQMSSTGPSGPWTEITRIAGPLNYSYNYFVSSPTYDITAHSSASSVLRIITSKYVRDSAKVLFDNIEVSCSP